MANAFEFKLMSASNLTKTPQEDLKNVQTDFTSVFGNAGNSFLKGIPVLAKDENMDTPFSYENVMKNIFVEDYTQDMASVSGDEYFVEDDDEIIPALQFEC